MDETYVTAGEAMLFCRMRPGRGAPVVFVHGSLDDHRTWTGCIAHLPADVPVVAYDRRGHSRSTAPAGQGVIADDVADLTAILDAVGRPSVVVGHSYGATVALLAVLEQPARVVAMVGHEPPMFGVLTTHPEHRELADGVRRAMARAAELIEGGEAAAGVRLFVEEVAFGPGVWDEVFDADARDTMVANAHTWLDQYRDPQRLAVTADRLATARRPVVITSGTASLPAFGASLDLTLSGVPNAERRLIAGAGHAAPHTHPAQLADVVIAVRAGVS